MRDILQSVLSARKPVKIPCPKCGVADSSVPSTHYNRAKNRYPGIRRLRLCKFCGAKFSTVEILEEDYKTYLKSHRYITELFSNLIKMKGFIPMLNKVNEEEIENEK